MFCCGGVSWWSGACSSLGKWPQHAKFWTKEYGFLHSEALYDSIVFWHSLWIIMHHLTIQCQRSNSIKTLREIWKSCKPMVWGKSVLWCSMVNCPTDTGANPCSPRSWLKTGCFKQRPNTLRQISPRKLQAVISTHPTKYLGGSSWTWHIRLETPKGVKKEPTQLAWQRKWRQSNETCSLPHHMAWPLRRWASKLYACAAALVARRQPVQVCREASRNALHTSTG